MAFELETSKTANDARMAVLWRDRNKQGGGAGIPERLLRELLEGAWRDGNEELPLADRPTIWTAVGEDDLKSFFQMVLDIRNFIVSTSHPNAPRLTERISPVDGAPFFGADLLSTLVDIRALTTGNDAETLRAGDLTSIWAVLLDLRRAIYGIVGGPEPTQRIRMWMNDEDLGEQIPGITLSLLQALRSLNSRIEFLEAQVDSLAMRVANLEGAPA